MGASWPPTKSWSKSWIRGAGADESHAPQNEQKGKRPSSGTGRGDPSTDRQDRRVCQTHWMIYAGKTTASTPETRSRSGMFMGSAKGPALVPASPGDPSGTLNQRLWIPPQDISCCNPSEHQPFQPQELERPIHWGPSPRVASPPYRRAIQLLGHTSTAWKKRSSAGLSWACEVTPRLCG